MNRATLFALALVACGGGACFGQVSGNAAFGQAGGRDRAAQVERAKRTLAEHELPPAGSSTFVEAAVLANVKADAFVATFALAREGPTAAECHRLMDEAVARFVEDIKALGVRGPEIFVDYVAQVQVYGFEVEGDEAREELVGYELKKNVSVRYADRTLLDRLVLAAARSEVHDLIEVDYWAVNLQLTGKASAASGERRPV
ncbi:SIMPL domain-containing protein [Tautonia plasticadhaerens]|uniref:Lipoprotein n=1 Tax=Tautonia plasticadhaerens TaxID=2527974 RepID=A0A518HE92_9BACT|nr:SIMPL domain-containing protein [Tautonia plasticadhaerens]QDV39170.1 hypothetical protein ElP_71340 [Tautonia plasticadhaerens]